MRRFLATVALWLVPALGSAQVLPVEHWNFDATSGSMVGIVNGHTLVEQVATFTSVAGKIINARDAEATSTVYAQATDHADLSGGNRTFGGILWHKPETVSGVIADHGWQAASDSNRAWILWYNTTSTVRFTMQNGGFVRDLTSSSPSITTGAWFRICWWYDANTDLMNLKINNGTTVTLGDTLGSFDSNRVFRIGASPGQGLYADGSYDDFSWFINSYPDETQLLSMWNGGNSLPYPFSTSIAPIIFRLRLSSLARPSGWEQFVSNTPIYFAK